MAFTNTAQKGSGIIIAKGATAIGGFRTRSFSLNGETVDVTTADDTDRWRRLLPATGVQSMSFTGSGVVKDVATQQQMVTDQIAATTDTYTFTFPGLGAFTGLYQLPTFTADGPYNGEASFTATWESGGQITFTAEG